MNKLRKELWGNECYNHKTVAGWRKKGVRTTKNSSLREKILYFAKKLRVCVCWWVLQTFPSQPHVKAISDPFRVASSWDVRKISTKKRNERSDRVRNSQIVNFMAFNKSFLVFIDRPHGSVEHNFIELLRFCRRLFFRRSDVKEIFNTVWGALRNKKLFTSLSLSLAVLELDKQTREWEWSIEFIYLLYIDLCIAMYLNFKQCRVLW